MIERWPMFYKRTRHSSPYSRNKLRPWHTGSKKRSMFKWLTDNSEALKIFFAVLAGGYALYLYNDKDYIDRVKNASDVIAKYQETDNYESLVRIEDLWLSKDIVQKRSDLLADKLTGKEYRQYVLDRMRRTHRADFINAARGLNEVSVCAIQGRCDPATMCMYLAQRIQDFRCNYREYVAELSDASASCIVDEASFVADTYCGKWIGMYLGTAEYRDSRDNKCLYDPKTQRSLIGDKCFKSIVYKKPQRPLEWLWERVAP